MKEVDIGLCGTQHIERIAPFYKKMFEHMKDVDEFPNLSHFVAMEGAAYKNQKDNKFMVIGRAANGWESLRCDSADNFGLDAEMRFCKKGFSWLEMTDKGFGNGDGYYINNSPFWRVIKKICKSNPMLANEERWFENIVWTNIYKVSPKDNGEKGITRNPSNKLCKKQIGICREILKQEIIEHSPDYILFVTGYNWWFHDDSGAYGVSDLFENIRKTLDNKYVEALARFKMEEFDIPVVIASRPERKNEAEYVSAVVDAFRK